MKSNNLENKICIICKESLPNTSDYFYRNKGCKYGLTPRCKICIESIRDGKYLIIEHQKIIKHGYKVCTKCNKLKKESEYYKDNRNPDKHRQDCKICTKNRVNKYYYNNKKSILKKVRAYQKTENGKHTDRKKHAKRRKLGYIEMFPNPFSKSEKIEWHHIGNSPYVVAVPIDLHQLYLGKVHKDNCMEIVKQIYKIR